MPRFHRRRSSKSAKNVDTSNIKKIVNKLLEPELKYLDTLLAQTSFSTGNMHLVTSGYLTDIDQGAWQNARIGLKTKLKEIQLNYTLINSTGALNNVVRVVIVRDKQNGTALSLDVDDVFEPASSAPYNSLMDAKREGERFTVLYDKSHQMATASGAILNKSITLKVNRNLSFTGAQGDDFGAGGVYMYVGSFNGTNRPSIGFNCRATFWDV